MTRPQRPSAEAIADAIISDIRSGRLEPGDRIREQEIAERFSTSRGPVREALKSLASQHWVAHEPGKGARVNQLDRASDPDAAVVGVALTGVMARFAAQRATDAELVELERRVRQVARAAQDEVPAEAFSEMLWDVGRLVLRIARSPLLSQILEPIYQGGLPHLALAGLASQHQRVEAARIWVDLVIALSRRDPHAAEELIGLNIKRNQQARLRAAIDPDLFDFDWNPPKRGGGD